MGWVWKAEVTRGRIIKKLKPNLKKTQNVEWFALKGQILFWPFKNREKIYILWHSNSPIIV